MWTARSGNPSTHGRANRARCGTCGPQVMVFCWSPMSVEVFVKKAILFRRTRKDKNLVKKVIFRSVKKVMFFLEYKKAMFLAHIGPRCHVCKGTYYILWFWRRRHTICVQRRITCVMSTSILGLFEVLRWPLCCGGPVVGGCSWWRRVEGEG